MNPTKMAQKQMALANVAQAQPSHRFTNLYSLLHWDCWMDSAAQAVLARPGSSTAGVDGTTRAGFKAHYEQELAQLIASLKHKTYTPQPVRRTYIPKSNGKMRPLGIPGLRDRIVQEAIRALLDPIYESDFQPHSYGFRKGRCTMDAIGFMMPYFNATGKCYYVIEGDLESYFDTVHHRKLMSILRQRIADPDLLDLIWKFLKAGVLEGGLFTRTESGVPQGGVLSPLLANVYLNEFDKWAAQKWHVDKATRSKRRQAGTGNYRLIRYADDFVVLSNDRIAGVCQAKEEIRDFLETELHLKLSEEKTHITHVNEGFAFLGFHIQRRWSEGRWVVYVRPTEQGKTRIKAKIKDLTSRSWAWMDEYTRLTTLNALVRGWAAYYRHTSLIRDIEEITRYTWHRYLLWLRKKHKGSRKGMLIHAKTRTIHNRTRWTAEISEGGHTLFAYQWLPTRVEYHRSRYLRKGAAAFPHPYLEAGRGTGSDYPMGETGPNERSYTARIGVPSGKTSRKEPLELTEWKLRAKIRDRFRCVRCGSREQLQVHHSKGTKSHRVADLETLCLKCHQAASQAQRQKGPPNGEPEVLKGTHPVR